MDVEGESTAMSIRHMQKRVWEITEAHGFHTDRSVLERIALVMSELGEAVEAERQPGTHYHTPSGVWHEPDSGKPEGVAVELADAVIRIMDIFETEGWDLETVLAEKVSYNDTRSHRHGRKLY